MNDRWPRAIESSRSAIGRVVVFAFLLRMSDALIPSPLVSFVAAIAVAVFYVVVSALPPDERSSRLTELRAADARAVEEYQSQRWVRARQVTALAAPQMAPCPPRSSAVLRVIRRRAAARAGRQN